MHRIGVARGDHERVVGALDVRDERRAIEAEHVRGDLEDADQRLGVVAVGGEHLVDLRERVGSRALAPRPRLQEVAAARREQRARRPAGERRRSRRPRAPRRASPTRHRRHDREDRDLGERRHVARLGDELDHRVARDHDEAGNTSLTDNVFAACASSPLAASCATRAARSSSVPPSTTIGGLSTGRERYHGTRVALSVLVLGELLYRFLVGGLCVSMFSVIGEMFEPKRFSGIFGAAPSVAIATLGLTFLQHGGNTVATEGAWMVVGARRDAAVRRGERVAGEAPGRPGVVRRERRMDRMVRVRVRRVVRAAQGAARVRPRLAARQARDMKAWEYAVRFAFGGVITVLTGLIAKYHGPAVAGMFLAFPAILPASLTLVKQHEGRKKAADDARGARVGAVGLVAFAIVVALTAISWSAAACSSARRLRGSRCRSSCGRASTRGGRRPEIPRTPPRRRGDPRILDLADEVAAAHPALVVAGVTKLPQLAQRK